MTLQIETKKETTPSEPEPNSRTSEQLEVAFANNIADSNNAVNHSNEYSSEYQNGAELFTFFFGGDILGESWDMGNMGGEKERARQHGLLDIAIGFAGEL